MLTVALPLSRQGLVASVDAGRRRVNIVVLFLDIGGILRFIRLGDSFLTSKIDPAVDLNVRVRFSDIL